MSVLHLYDKSDLLIAQHVAMLEAQANNQWSSLAKDACQTGTVDGQWSIVHVHGCWNRSIVRKALRLRRQGARIVLSPHGHLEPWIINQQRMIEKTAKILIWQKRLASNAYALIAHGKMEAEALRTLGWNLHIENIGNAVISNTITPEAMVRQTEAVYQKVLDSNTLAYMSDDLRSLMAVLLKAGITGDRRWVEASPIPFQGGKFQPETMRAADSASWDEAVEASSWRLILLYANHENVRDIIDQGICVLGLHSPLLEKEEDKLKVSSSYFPANYRQPTVTATDAVGIVEEARRGPLTLLHLVALARALRRPDADDEQIAEALAEKHLTRYFQRLLQLLQEQMLQEEGFLPLNPINDRQTQRLRQQLANHLTI